mgnify:FL=1
MTAAAALAATSRAEERLDAMEETTQLHEIFTL